MRETNGATYQVGYGRPPVSTRFKPANQAIVCRAPRAVTDVKQSVYFTHPFRRLLHSL